MVAMVTPRSIVTLALIWSALAIGCRSPYYSDRGAVAGGLAGAGIGAALGNASGNAGPAALAGAAIGAITGNVVGESIDADLARSKAEIEARMGRQMSGAVSNDDVIAMTQAGLSEDVISTHIRAHGVARSPSVNDLIVLRNQGVSDRVIQALQRTPPPAAAQAVYAPAGYVVGPPRGVIVENYYEPWYRCPPPYAHFHYYDRHWHRPGPSWGFSFSN
jgi:Outer membrane lipoprotein